MMNRFFKPPVTSIPKIPGPSGAVTFLGVAIMNAVLQRAWEKHLFNDNNSERLPSDPNPAWQPQKPGI